jgi:hypothetical protein
MDIGDLFVADNRQNRLGFHGVVGGQDPGMQDCDHIPAFAGRYCIGIVQLIRIDKDRVTLFQKDRGAVHTIAHAGRMDTEQFNVLMKVCDLFPCASAVDISVMDIGREGRIVIIDEFGSVISCSDQTPVFIYHYITPCSNIVIKIWNFITIYSF